MNGSIVNIKDSNIPPSPPPSILLISLISLWVELLIVHPSVLLLAILNLSILLSIKVIHPNLRLILQIQSASILLFQSYCIWSAVEKLANGWNPFYECSQMNQNFGLFSALIRNSMGHILFIERLWATLFYRKYEKCNNFYFSAIWFCILFSLSALNSFINSKSWSFSTLNLIFSTGLMAFCLLEFLLIILLGIHNRHKYNEFIPSAAHQKYTLSEKFQLAENIRTSRQLSPALFCHFGNNVLMFLCGGLAIYSGWLLGWQIAVSIQLATIFSSLFDAAIETTVITHHPMFKRNLGRKLRRICHPLRTHRIGLSSINSHTPTSGNCNDGEIIRNLNGDILIQENTGDAHFRVLTESWK